MNATIILRTCDKVEVFNGGNKKNRDFGTKKEVMELCAKSLKRSIDFFKSDSAIKMDLSVIVIDDNSSEEMISFLKETLDPSEFISLNQNGGNGASFKACLDKAITCTGPVFFLEDDYLISKECIDEMLALYVEHYVTRGVKAFYHPVDYPDRYANCYASFVITSKNRHWRTVQHTTCTFMGDASMIKEFYSTLSQFEFYGKSPSVNEDTTINLMYRKYPCFSPIRSLAEHLQFKETLSPYFRYEDYLMEKLSLQNY